MLICEIDEKKDKVKIRVEGSVVEIAQDLSIELYSLLENGVRLECLVAALVHATKDKMDQDDFNQTCSVISDLLQAIRDN